MDKNGFAPRPPMGWNSYDYYDTTVTEQDVLKNAEYMAENLKKYGWEYIVVDIQWYARRPDARREEYQYLPFGELAMDEWSRLLPDPERFPSAANGAGFKPLADRVHALGLKFGIHIMRGIPRAAAHRRMKVPGTDLTADEIADPSSVCRWNPDMYGVRDTAAGQAYYDSLIDLYASWGVDFIKCDDICNTDNWIPGSPRATEGRHETQMLRRAIDRSGREIVLSLSPGPALLSMADFYAENANMWRITDDMWDRWDHVLNMFSRCEQWQGRTRPGCYPDCDMLPLGRVGRGFRDERDSRLTPDEQRTVMTLWCVFGSPLMLGAELTLLDGPTLALITNSQVLSLLDPANTRHQERRTDSEAVWTLETPEGRRYAALFNLSDKPRVTAAEVPGAGVRFRELWTGVTGEARGALAPLLPPHGCRLYSLTTIC